jgi:hypothetical protein
MAKKKKKGQQASDTQMVVFMLLMLTSGGLLAYNMFFPEEFNAYNFAVAFAIGLITILYYLNYRKTA